MVWRLIWETSTWSEDCSQLLTNCLEIALRPCTMSEDSSHSLAHCQKIALRDSHFLVWFILIFVYIVSMIWITFTHKHRIPLNYIFNICKWFWYAFSIYKFALKHLVLYIQLHFELPLFDFTCILVMSEREVHPHKIPWPIETGFIKILQHLQIVKI